MIRNNRTYKHIAVIVAVMTAAAWLSACEPVTKVFEVAESISREIPTSRDTFTSILEINQAMEKAMSRGESELTMNVANVTEKELRSIGDNMSTFWGKPTHYTITNEFNDIEGIVQGRPVDVKTISNAFQLSYNFYVYDFIKNGVEIPDDYPRAAEIADVLPAIAAEIFKDPDASDYENTLAAHNWLVANVEYDVTTPSISDENGIYGALILRHTMCQGYAEALELLLKCYTDVEIVQIVGEALNIGLFGNIEDQDFSSDDWRGHAWNVVKMDGEWYQVDTTFNDPLGNPTGRVSHFYFGQSDAVMLQNHRWTYEFFPSSYAGDFLFFRNSGLFAEDWDDFQSKVENLLTEDPADYFEIAVYRETITEENIQFVYKALPNLEALRWSEQVWKDIHVHSIELVF